ncbi:MAG TPA: Rid family detoxifying hydrolase [Chlamydiales bacterium]|nr:Rid family detoxifying hydrolase [Chlamydiales bacterium]
MNPNIRKIETAGAPKARGPYSQAVRVENLLFVSGQVARDPKTNKISDSTIQGQTHRVLDNIEAILKAAGLSLADVVKTDVFLMDMGQLQEMNAVYERRFSYPIKPARVAVQVRLPSEGALVEISCIAVSRKV